MKYSEAFPSKWIAAADLENKNVRLAIARIEMDKVGDEMKPIVFFTKAKKGLVLNKTNAKAIAEAYGDEMDNWAGNELILFPIITDYQGKQVDAVRVRAPQPKDNPRPQQQQGRSTPLPQQAPMNGSDFDDEIPF